MQPGPWAAPPPQAQGPLQSSPGPGALRTVLCPEELLGTPSQQQGEQEAPAHTEQHQVTEQHLLFTPFRNVCWMYFNPDTISLFTCRESSRN